MIHDYIEFNEKYIIMKHDNIKKYIETIRKHTHNLFCQTDELRIYLNTQCWRIMLYFLINWCSISLWKDEVVNTKSSYSPDYLLPIFFIVCKFHTESIYFARKCRREIWFLLALNQHSCHACVANMYYYYYFAPTRREDRVPLQNLQNCHGILSRMDC